MKYIDIDGDSIFIGFREQEMILGYINSLSEGVFDVDDKGFLYMREGKKNVRVCIQCIIAISENIIRKETMSPLRPWNTYLKNDWSVNGMTYSLSLVLIRTLFPKINFGQ